MAKQKTRPPKTIRKLTEVTLDPRNANRHTERGASMMESSIRESGFGDSITVDRHGVVISGGQRTETLVDLQMVDPIVVQSDGTRPIIHQRTDLEASDPRAKKLALFSNRVGEVNLDWDPAQLQAMLADDLDLSKLWSAKELDALLEPVGDAGGGEGSGAGESDAQFLVLVTCESETEQRVLIERFLKEGLACRALNA